MRSHARHAAVTHHPVRDGVAAVPALLSGLITAGLLLAAAGLLFGAYAIVSLHVASQTVLTGSMRGTFDPGDLVLTRPVPVSAIKPGDVIVFTPPGHTTPYTHRVLTISGPADKRVITTKGDANPAPDSWKAVLHGTTAPRVFAHVPALGGVLLKVQSQGLRNPLLAVLGVVIAVSGAGLILGSSRPRPTRTTRTTRTRPAHVIALPTTQGARPCPSTPLPARPVAMPAPLPLPRSESLPLPSPELASTQA